MVNVETWNKLGADGQQEFRSLFDLFRARLREHGIHDGYDLDMEWRVVELDGQYAISDGSAVLEGVSSPRRDVVQALYDDGCANLNR